MPIRYVDSSVMTWLKVAIDAQSAANEPTPAQMYAALELYYLNNGLYDSIQQSAKDQGLWTEAMKGLRNPAHRVVEFYVSKLWPGQLPDALPIQTENQKIIDPIHQVWEWSNWDAKKQVGARWFSMYGDWFIKVDTKTNDAGEVERVYLRNMKPHYITSFNTDERGYMTAIRIDIPRSRKTNGRAEAYLHTEIWDKNLGTYRLWEHKKTIKTEPERLGPPVEETPLEAFGIDFIPFVHAQFNDIGDPRGVGSFTHSLDKIDEINRQATRLHQMMYRYNKPIWAITANMMDATGRPLPAPRVGSASGTDDSDTVTMGDDDQFWRLPGMSKLEALIPALNYSAHLETIKEMMLELERDLPELAYFRLREHGGDISGRAVRMMLSDAIDKAKEARGNGESALARADAMALTIGQAAGLFSGMGTYEKGDFEHDFSERDIIPLTQSEKAEIVKEEVAAGIPLITALRRAGWTDEEIDQLKKDKEDAQKEQQNTLANAMLSAQRNFDRGNNPPQNQNDQDDQDGDQAGNQSQ